jgi:hypothetical protein
MLWYFKKLMMTFTFETLHLKNNNKLNCINVWAVRTLQEWGTNVYRVFFNINIQLKWNFEWTCEIYSSISP